MRARKAGTVSENSVRHRNLLAVYDTMENIAKQRGLSASVDDMPGGELAVVEGFAHELAHQLEAGGDFESRIRASSNEKADDHEAATLRIEVEALATLGVRVSFRNLWSDANWRSERPVLTRESRLLSNRERRCAAVFSRIVRDMIQRQRGLGTQNPPVGRACPLSPSPRFPVTPRRRPAVTMRG